MKKAIAVMLIVLLVMTAAACQGGETTSSQAAPQSTESSQTERSTEGTTEAPTTTETSTTEAPTTTEVPTTEAPTTEAPTTTEAPVQPVFRTGLYELKGSWDERPMNKIGSATYYFSDAGQFCCEVSYKDASGSVNTDQVGNYVADGDTLTLYYWFSRGGDPSWNACMYAQDVFTIAGEDLLRTETVSEDETLEFSLSSDKDKEARMAFSPTAASVINSKYLFNGYGNPVPDDLELPQCTELYRYAGRSGELLGTAELGLFANGRFCLTTSFTDGAGGGTICGNYTVDEKQIHCYAWFSQAGDPVSYVTPDTVYDFWILDNDRVMVHELAGSEMLYFDQVKDAAEKDNFAKFNDFTRMIQYGRISKTP